MIKAITRINPYIISLVILCSAPLVLHAKIYDCFTFFNELELLDIRFHELYDHVDYFVIVESVETFRGNPKSLYFEKNKDRFEKFSDKIIHIVLTERTMTQNPWIREEFQRNQIMRGLSNCEPHDLIMISDVDEIVRAEALPKIEQAIFYENHKIIVCEQTLYRFYLNAKDLSFLWGGTCAMSYRYLKKNSPHSLRLKRTNGGPVFHYPLILNAGWHFTSLGGLERHIQKIESFSHTEVDLPTNKNQKYILKYIEDHCEIVHFNNSYPKYILDNLSSFQENGFIYN